MATNKKITKPTEPESDNEVIDGPETEPTGDPSDAGAEESDPSDATADGDTTSEQKPSEVVHDQAAIQAPSTETAEEDASQVQPLEMTIRIDSSEAMEAVRDYVATLGNLHDRLSKAVRSLAADAGQEKTFALHQLEVLTGRLKMVLPAGIAATEKELQSALNTLLGLL